MAKSRLLITGGFGLIGGRLAQHLSKDYKIVLGTRKRYESVQWLPTAEIVQIDWDNPTSLNAACARVDMIIHASGMNANECCEDPGKALIVNGIYTENLVNAAINQGVKDFFYLSSVHVYSSKLSGVISEKNETVNGHPYATSHLYGENAVRLAFKNGALEGKVLRLSNAFGAPTHKGVNCWMLLSSDLCKQVITKRRLYLNSNGDQVRDFVTISDVCSCIEHLIKHSNRSKSDIVNVGSGKSLTIKEIALRIQDICVKLLGFKPVLIYKNPIIKPAKNLLFFKTNHLDGLNFEFKNDIDKELEDLVNFCNENFIYED